MEKWLIAIKVVGTVNFLVLLFAKPVAGFRINLWLLEAFLLVYCVIIS